MDEVERKRLQELAGVKYISPTVRQKNTILSYIMNVIDMVKTYLIVGLGMVFASISYVIMVKILRKSDYRVGK